MKLTRSYILYLIKKYGGQETLAEAIRKELDFKK
jgi:hypothetical protein